MRLPGLRDIPLDKVDITEYHWFECPCGTEWWTATTRCFGSGFCWRCRTWLGRRVMQLFGAGT